MAYRIARTHAQVTSCCTQCGHTHQAPTERALFTWQRAHTEQHRQAQQTGNPGTHQNAARTPHAHQSPPTRHDASQRD